MFLIRAIRVIRLIRDSRVFNFITSNNHCNKMVIHPKNRGLRGAPHFQTFPLKEPLKKKQREKGKRALGQRAISPRHRRHNPTPEVAVPFVRVEPDAVGGTGAPRVVVPRAATQHSAAFSFPRSAWECLPGRSASCQVPP